MKGTLHWLSERWVGLATGATLLVVLATAAVTWQQWYPSLKTWMTTKRTTAGDTHTHGGGHSHGSSHSHGGSAHSHAGSGQPHPGHDDALALQLSPAALRNIGLETGIVTPQTFVKTVSVPAMVAERPGRSQVGITAPMTGTVTRVYPVEGEAIQPGQPLFELRLVHEDLVVSQRDFLKTAQELEVVEREIARLQSVGEGVVAGRRIVEQQYDQEKLLATLHAQRQGLLLHGLNNEQIDQILATRQLLPSLTVFAPQFPEQGEHQDIQHIFHVQKINVKLGEHIAAGSALCTLADHCLLYVEGQAFEADAQRLIQAAREGWNIEVVDVSEPDARRRPLQLNILYIADHVDQQTRSLKFYMDLPNQLIRDQAQGDHRFVAWQFRPGQRLEVKLPLAAPWENQIVLPPEAVVDEGADVFVFQWNKDHFDRVPVHVIYRDKDAVVVENDGTLAGRTVAMSGAYQMHLAIKNRASGLDAHAGHHH